jgi:hypothetical protein
MQGDLSWFPAYAGNSRIPVSTGMNDSKGRTAVRPYSCADVAASHLRVFGRRFQEETLLQKGFLLEFFFSRLLPLHEGAIAVGFIEHTVGIDQAVQCSGFGLSHEPDGMAVVVATGTVFGHTLRFGVGQQVRAWFR